MEVICLRAVEGRRPLWERAEALTKVVEGRRSLWERAQAPTRLTEFSTGEKRCRVTGGFELNRTVWTK